MKCMLIAEKEIYEPGAPRELVSQCERRGKHLFAPAGTLLDDPNCWLIVKMGQAIPADDECREKVDMTAEQMDAAQKAARRLAAGIAPEDYAKFDEGQIVGYNADGSYKPGPNWKQPAAANEDEEQ
jgi:hypothetical protein